MRQVLEAGALGRPRRIGWGGRREGGSGWATHVNPRLIHVNVWQKPLQYCKVINLQLIKINEKTKQKSANPIEGEPFFQELPHFRFKGPVFKKKKKSQRILKITKALPNQRKKRIWECKMIQLL